MRTEQKFNKIVNFDKESNEITVLDSVFKYDDSFKGATGSKFLPVSKSEYKERTKKDNVIEQIIECGLPENFQKTDAFIFECIGGGRCFDKDFQGNINSELSEIIREYEN